MKLRLLEYTLWTLAGLVILGVVGWAALTVSRPQASLSLETTPARASVWIDGNWVGTTPVEIAQVPQQTYVVRLRKFGHEAMTREVTVHPGENVLRLDLEKLPGGSFEIHSRPEGAQVFIDGQPRGLTPLTVGDLLPGSYQLRLRLVNYLDWTGTVNVEPDQTVRRTAALRSRTEAGYLAAIKADPTDVIAYADLAHYYILRDEWTKATDALAKALVITAKHPGAAHYSGRLQQEVQKVWGMQFKYSDRRRGQEVIVDAYIRAVKTYPSYQRYYGEAIQYATQLTKKKEAQEIIETGILNFPHSQSWAVATLPRWRRRGSEDERLLRQLNSRLKKDPNDFVSRFQRATLLRQQGKTDAVVTDYEAMVPLTKSPRIRARLLLELGRMYERKQNYDKAADAYRHAAEAETVPTDRAPVYYNLARVMGKRKRNADTLAAWEKAVAFQENVEVACRWRLDWAALCVKLNQKAKARTILAEVLKNSRDTKTRTQAQAMIDKL